MPSHCGGQPPAASPAAAADPLLRSGTSRTQTDAATVAKIDPMLKPDARAFHEQGAAEALRIGRYERSGGIYVWMHLHGRHVGGELGQIRQVLGK